jgi:hypothetical protein
MNILKILAGFKTNHNGIFLNKTFGNVDTPV